jgi:hypothetical protein
VQQQAAQQKPVQQQHPSQVQQQQLQVQARSQTQTQQNQPQRQYQQHYHRAQQQQQQYQQYQQYQQWSPYGQAMGGYFPHQCYATYPGWPYGPSMPPPFTYGGLPLDFYGQHPAAAMPAGFFPRH